MKSATAQLPSASALRCRDSAFHAPRSSHSNAPSATITFCACSINAKSIEIFLMSGYSFARILFSLTARRDIERIRKHLLKFFLVRNDVVGGQHGHHTGRRARPDERRAERDRGAGIAADRFGDDIDLWQLRQLFPHLGGLRFVRDDE